MKKFVCTGVLFTLLFFIYSCKDEYTLCNLSKEVSFISGFYQKVSGADVSVQAPSLYVSLLNSSSGIYTGQPNVRSFSLPLNSLVDSSRYTIQIGAGLPTDTLTVVYSSTSTNLSAECGNVIYNNISRFYTTKHRLDSVKIVNATTNTNPLENARIYFH